MWCLLSDNSKAVITAVEQIHSAHRECCLHLPETAIVFFMSKGTDYLLAHYNTVEMAELFPRFLNRCPIWEMKDCPVCFLDGGRGAPQAADTVETLAALGVKTIIVVGMFGAFDERVHVGEIITPQKAFVEEGTSLHYYESIDFSVPNHDLFDMAASLLNINTYPIVSTDAVYRQTFRKEQLWRENGAVGVDMETSAVFSVSRRLGLKAVALLMASDIHPVKPDAPKWEWHMTKEMKYHLTEQGAALARQLFECNSEDQTQKNLPNRELRRNAR